MPGRSTAGATFDSTAGASGSFEAKSSGWRASSDDRNASEIFGVCPSSRRKLAQNAASMIAAIASGGGVFEATELSAARAAPICRAKCRCTTR